jgi:hypothetical protein
MLTTPTSITALASRNASNAPGTVAGEDYQRAQRDVSTCIRLERQLAREIGPVETARRSLTLAWDDVFAATARFQAMEELCREEPSNARWAEQLATRRAELTECLSWLQDRAAKLSQAINNDPEPHDSSKRAA